MSLLNKRSIFYIMKLIFNTLISYDTISLALIISLISILGYLMDKFLLLERMIISLENILRSLKITMLISPAIIGTLLVTGGALMSCPVVDSIGNRLGVRNDEKAAINLVFRHALYFIFPLSPAFILASRLGDFNIVDFIKVQFPIAISMYIVGYFVYLRKYDSPKVDKINYKNYFFSILKFIFYSSPIIISLVGTLLLKIPFYLSLSLGILITIIINYFDKKKDDKYNTNEKLINIIYNGFKPSMVIAVIGIMIFKNVVNDTEELFIYINSLVDKGIPLEIIMISASSLISFSLASTQPSIAILFPMILPLAKTYEIKLLYAMFIYTTSFLFYYISPLHMCQVLTLEYFDVKIKDLYKNYYYVLPIVFLVMIIIYYIKLV